MKIVRARVGSLLVLALAVLVASVATRRLAADAVGAGDAPLADQAVPGGDGCAAAGPTPPPLPTLVPTPPPLPSLPPTPRLTGPDPANAVPGREVPAIPPSRPGASPDQATFTEEEVRAFIAKRGAGFGKMRVAGPYEIESVIVLRSIEVPARLGVVAGGMNDQLLAAATLRGTFTVTGPPGPGAQVYTYSKVVLVFDARTGNLLDQIALP